MKKTVYYSEIEKIEFIFSEYEIREALINYFIKPNYHPMPEIKFFIEDIENGNSSEAHITLLFESPIESPQEIDNDK